jgi:chemotaxis protein methyltransferase CheR
MAVDHESPGTRTALLLIRDLIAERMGIRFEDKMTDILMSKISPLVAERGFDALLDYYYLLKYDEDQDEEWARLINALSVRESYFWREFDQVQCLVDRVLPALISSSGRDPIRIWSAACAGGEEPLSIAIALKERGWFDRVPIEIHATDGSPRSIEIAKAGIYRQRSFRALPEEIRGKYFRPHENGWKVDSSIHRRIQWSVVNLLDDTAIARFASVPVIFCRNVFIYFSEAGVRRAVRTFYEHMPTPGYLFVGVAESLLKLSTPFELRKLGEAFVYVKEASCVEGIHG